jgi:nucleotide-binding universal stress UspA family protein
MHEVVVACADGSPGGYAAVAEAAEVVRRFNARLVALSVEEGLPRYAATMGEVDEFKRERDTYFETVGREAARIAGKHGARLTHEIRVGHAADAIVRFVREVGADLVVLGYKGHSRIASFVIGTTAQKVNAYSRASVLIAKDTPSPRLTDLQDHQGGGAHDHHPARR